MVNGRQDGVPDETLSPEPVSTSQGPAEHGKGASPRTFLLSITLRIGDGERAANEDLWTADLPQGALIVDLVTASGGACDPPQGPVLTARFLTLKDALLTARRLEWALQGMGETGIRADAASLIYSTDDGIGSAAAVGVDNAPPGQVLVSSGVADAVKQLPGSVLRQSAAANWLAVEWKSSEGAWTSTSDEELLLRMISEQRREDPLTSRRDAPEQTASVGRAWDRPATAVADGLTAAQVGVEPAPTGKGKKWAIVGGAAAAVVLAAVFIAVSLSSGSREKASAPTANPPAHASPTTPAGSPSAEDVGTAEKPQPENPPAVPARKSPKKTKAPDVTAEAKPEVKIEPAVQKATCVLTEGEIPRSLKRAEDLMYAGKLAESQAGYQRLLGCPSAHDAAAEGLQKVRQRMAAQSPLPQ